MPITATATDRFANLVGGVDVAFSASRGRLRPEFARTGARGFVTTTLYSPDEAGEAVIEARSGNLSDSAEVRFVAGAVAEVRVAPRRERLMLGGSVPVDAWLRDRFRNPVAASRVVFATSNGRMLPPAAVSDAEGRATSILWASRTGVAVVTAVSGGILGSARIDVTPARLHLPFVSRPR